MLKRTKQILPLSFLALTLASAPLGAQDFKVCQKVVGTTTESIIPKDTSPNDPFGRIVGQFTGNFAGTANVPYTAILLSPPIFSSVGFPNLPNYIQVKEVFVTGPGDTVSVAGTSVFNLAPSLVPSESPTTTATNRCPGVPCMVQAPKLLKITGGTGRWTGATGEIRGIGLGNLNLPVGQGTFVFSIDGEICLPGSELGSAPSRQ